MFTVFLSFLFSYSGRKRYPTVVKFAPVQTRQNFYFPVVVSGDWLRIHLHSRAIQCGQPSVAERLFTLALQQVTSNFRDSSTVRFASSKANGFSRDMKDPPASHAKMARVIWRTNAHPAPPHGNKTSCTAHWIVKSRVLNASCFSIHRTRAFTWTP